MNTATEQPPQFTTASFRDIPPDSHALFVRGLLFGVGGAFLGLILYSAVGIITGLAIGYVSLAVGYIVGRAILMGSRGRGGRRYQIAALLLTYASVSVSAVPIALWQISKKPATAPTSITAGATASPTPGAAATATPVADRGATATPETGAGDGPHMGFAAALGMLLMLGLASPFLELFEGGISGMIGLFILAIGLRIAWRQTAEAVLTPVPAADAR